MLPWLSFEAKTILIAKWIRVFAYGYMSIVLPFYLSYLGYSPTFIGIVITLAVLSNAIFNILVSKYAESFGRGKTLILFSFLMFLSSMLLLFPNAVSVILASILGVFSATGTEAGPFLSIEQAVLTKFVTNERRTFLFSLYNFLGYSASSIGSLFSSIPFRLTSRPLAFLFSIILYGLIGLTLLLLYLTLGNKLELNVEGKGRNYTLSEETKKKVIKLTLLFSVDAFGGGFVLQSILVLWFKYRFGIDLQEQSLIFFVSQIITALSFFLAERIARRIGLLNTMVFTHLPSNVFLMMVALAPTAPLAIAFLFMRQSLSQMDVPTRQSYVMAIVKPEERTAVAAITNVPRSLAQAASPYLATYAISLSIYYLPFILSGLVKIAYDISILFSFRNVKPPEEVK